MLDELLDALGVEKFARPESPAAVWLEALAKVRAAVAVAVPRPRA